MNLKQFGEELQMLRKARQWSQEALLEALDQLARPGPPDEYRVIDGTLLSRWERAHTQKGRHWKPTRTYMVHLIQLFAAQLDLVRAQTWAAQAGYTINAAELQTWFPGSTAAVSGTTANTQPVPADQEASHLATPHNLPTLLTSFVGREAEIARVLDYLAAPSARLITVVGEGGAGKTRLALEVAQGVVNQGSKQFRDGVYFVSLVGVSMASFVVNALANAVGLTLAGADDPQQQLLAYVQKRHLLLVLDNFEHLITDATSLISALLPAAPGVQLLVTSRERLNLAEEWVLTLTGLPFPAGSTTLGPAPSFGPPRPALKMAATYGAVELFLARARQADGGFDPARDPQQTVALARICELVQGIPLGLEMAAAWVHMLSCREIADEIAQNLDFLTSPHRNLPERQRSMRAVFEHSWRLLNETEQRVLAALAVFQGGFTREAATSVTKASLLTLRSLVDKSLLKVSEERYELHELLRQFAEEKLRVEATNEEAAHSRHAAFYGEMLKRDEALWDTEQRAALVGVVRNEIQNIRIGWRWAVTHKSLTVLDQYMQSLLDFYMTVNWFQEGRDAFQLAITHLELLEGKGSYGNLILAKVMSRCAHFSFQLGQYEIAQRRFEQSLTLVDDQHDAVEACFVSNSLGKIHHILGRYRVAQNWYQNGLEMAENAGDLVQKADLYYFLGGLAMDMGDYAEADHWYQCSLGLYRNQNSEHGIGLVLCGLGDVAQALGRFAIAERYLRQSLLLFEQMGNRKEIARISLQLGAIFQVAGNYEKTERCYQQGYNLAKEIHTPLILAQALCCLVDLACHYDQYGQAQDYLRSVWEIAISQKRDPLTLQIILSTATLLIKQSSQGQLLLKGSTPSESSVEPPYQLLKLIANHPASPFKLRNHAKTKLDELMTNLPLSVREKLTSQIPILKLEEVNLIWKRLLVLGQLS